MLEFIQLLKQRYQSVLAGLQSSEAKALYQQRIEQLLLAEAFVRKGLLIENSPQHPLQITIVGPTQAGKSSLVNVLLDTSVAGVSPLAGYTVHPQGFCHGVNLADLTGLQHYFGRFQQLQPSQLSPSRHDCYSVTELVSHSGNMPHGVIWDTPDFDSIDSSTYREGVIRAIALADIIILVVSKEKYADQSVWDMMKLLEGLHQPTIICLNKLGEGSEEVLIHSLKEKWQMVRHDAFPEVVPLYYAKQTGLPFWPEERQMLLSQVAERVNPKKHNRLQQDLLQKYWNEWLEPVMAEHQTLDTWQALCEAATQDALNAYERDYLNHPHHYETFQQALAELLTLLEIPGLAGLLTNLRKVLTWPVKQIMKLGRKRQHIADSSQEIVLLNQIAEHMLIQLADRLMDKTEQDPQSAWWKECGTLLRKQRQELLRDFSVAAKDYHLSFQLNVEDTAQALYHKLQEQPVVLNSLRATRVTADAAVIAITLHTGGIGVHDLVIAPAMLSITALLTESAIGGYMRKVEAQLKQQQLAAVRQALFTGCMAKTLLALPDQLSGNTYFSISKKQLHEAESQLTQMRHGLRLL